MSNTPTFDLAALHSAIKSEITEAFPNLQSVEFYPRAGERIVTPAIFFELDSIGVSTTPDMGTEQVMTQLTFNAYCVVSYKGAGKLATRTLAAQFMQWVKGRRFGQSIGAAQPMSADPDRLVGDAGNEYEVFRVMWTHEPCYLGESVWDYSGVVPTEVYLGYDPLTGQAHIQDYKKIYPEAP
jgi:hypothetical protein